jgi:hypothetical protein
MGEPHGVSRLHVFADETFRTILNGERSCLIALTSTTHLIVFKDDLSFHLSIRLRVPIYPENEAGPPHVQAPAAVVPAASPIYDKEETCFGKNPPFSHVYL